MTLILHVGLFEFLFCEAPVICREVEQMSRTIFRPDVSSASAWKPRAAALRLRSKRQTLSSDSEMRSRVASFHYLHDSRREKIHWPVSTPWRCHPRASSRSPGSWDGSARATSWGCTGRMRWSAPRWSPRTPCPGAPCRQNLPRTEKLH